MKNPIEMWRGGRSPFRELQQMQNSMERLFEDLAPWSSEMPTAAMSFNPRCDVQEDKERYYLKFDLPGVPKDQIKVELNDHTLTVSAERKSQDEKTDKKDGWRRFFSEVSYGSYTRSFTLPGAVDEKKVDAAYENGVLTVTVPKVQNSQAKQIAVQ